MISTNLLKGKKVKLTSINEKDIKSITKWYSDIDFLRFFDTAPALPKTEVQLGQWIKSVQDSYNSVAFAIRPIEEEEIVGYIELDKISWIHGVATVGIGIGTSEHRGKGFAKEALKLLMELAFNELNLHRLQLNVFNYNERAIMLYESLGFKREGTYREFIHRDGRRWDMYLYGILRDEWILSKEEF
ncbi:GNAT family N-acetyltransferase [Clostridium omnivorum]|uniref:N-acetyltransferase n=1 Tax=Clostridium omnivorum TaxID=1604902 RepID=A0ABQ5N7B7_9CLOT|nr:GNAT family protein [Clostridium sp. E14]GLC31055.1 N-acetyltransferase [Clostridium sp. E14]